MTGAGRFVCPVIWAVFALTACGDNGRLCGEGTTDLDGRCVPGSGSDLTCGDGTRLDPVLHACVPDATTCGGDTVLVNGVCQDPTAGLVVDVEEGPEPNGFEANAIPAGVIQLKPIGGPGVVVHGCVKPVDDAAADLDAYLLHVNAPTLIKVTADGVHGLAAGFFASGNAADPAIDSRLGSRSALPLATVPAPPGTRLASPGASYIRFGVNVATDTSRREIYLPAAGTYALVFSDTRSLLPTVLDGLPPAPGGNPDGSTCYYVTIDQRAITTSPLDLATGASGTLGEDLAFFDAALPEGFISLTESIHSEHAVSAIDVLDNNTIRTLASGNPNANALFGGIRTGDSALIVADYIVNYAIAPPAYTLAVDAALPSQAIGSGAVVNAVSKGQFFIDPDPSHDKSAHLGNLNLFHWDVDQANDVDAFDLTFSRPVTASVFDERGLVVATFTNIFTIPLTNQPPVPETPAPVTFTTYKGLVRTLTPGRYYVLAFLPRDPVGTAFTVTGTIASQTVPAIAPGTPLADQVPNALDSNPFTFDAGTVPWELFHASGTNTGAIQVRLYDAAKAIGRFDPLTITTGPGAGDSTFTDDASFTNARPVLELSFAQDGSTQIGGILRNPTALAPVAPTRFFARAVAATTANAKYTLDFAPRAFHDFATIAAGNGASVTNEPLDATHAERRYFVQTDRFNRVTLKVTPDAGLDAAIALVTTKELDAQVTDAAGAGLAEAITFTQRAQGFTAWKVRPSSGPPTGTQSYQLDVTIDPPFYSIQGSPTQFADACAGGTVQVARDCNFGNCLPSADEGMTDPIAVPAGFTFYGASVATFVASTNGFLSFAPTLDTNPFPVEFPDDTGTTNIAPFWADLDKVQICTKTVGQALVVQWTGREFGLGGQPVQFQAILDPATQTIEYVYGPGHKATGSTGLAGVQSPLGDEANQTGAFTSFVAPNTAKRLVHL